METFTMHLPDDTLLQGGRYKIVRFISSGGFGCTYEAEHVMLQKKVAIKEFFVKDFCNRDEKTAHITVGTNSKKGLVDHLRKKFIDEARTLSHMQHPNIVRVSDVFEENGTAYFVMDYINGKSLGEILKDKVSLPEQKALKYIRQVAKALEYVHNNNCLHLDVKPGNIMIDNNDDAILIDFGASKQYDEVAGENTSTLLGKTPGYAPLEQMGNDVVKFTPPTDIYALGATLYKLLSGITPLGANLLASGDKLAPLSGTISKNVTAAIDKAMQINKNNRPQSIREFLKILDSPTSVSPDEITVIDFNPQPRIGTPPKPQTKEYPKKKSFPISIISIVGVILIVIIIFLFPKKPISQSVETETSKYVHVQDVEYTYSGIKYKYTGDMNETGSPEGKGKGIYPDGTYEGEFINGCREGEGTFVTSDGMNTFVGKFSGDFYSEGRLTVYDGSYFEGTFNNNEPYTGVWYNEDGTVYCNIKQGNME